MSKDNSFWGGLSNSFSSFADSVSDGFSDFFSVDKTISTDAMTKPDDVIKTKSALSSLGNYDVPDFGLTDVPDMGMINGLKNFQADNGLKVDGIMKPGGPTENALGQTLAHQGITNTNLMETAKAQAPKAIGDLPEDTAISATSSFKDNSVKVQQPNLEKHKSLKVDPNTGMVQKKTPAPKPQKDMSKVWDDFYKQKEQKNKTAVVPQGDTVDKRIRSIMDDERYWKKREQPITDHVVKQFEKAYPGETQFDETGKMIQPKAVIQPDEVEPYDPDGELEVQSKPTGAKARYERRKALKDSSEASETLADKVEEFGNTAIDMVGNGLSRLNPISSANAGTPEMDHPSENQNQIAEPEKTALDPSYEQSSNGAKGRYERRNKFPLDGDDHRWETEDAVRMVLDDTFGVDPTQTHLRKHKDGWIKDKKESIKKYANKYNLPPEMLAGLAWSEVGGEPDSLDRFKHMVLQSPSTKPSNQLSAGDVSIQLRHVAEMEGLDPNNLTFKQEQQLINRLQNEDYNLEVVAKHIADMRDAVFPDQGKKALNNDQIKRLGYMYNMGKDHPMLQTDQDLSSADNSTVSNHGLDLMRKIERMRSLIE